MYTYWQFFTSLKVLHRFGLALPKDRPSKLYPTSQSFSINSLSFLLFLLQNKFLFGPFDRNLIRLDDNSEDDDDDNDDDDDDDDNDDDDDDDDNDKATLGSNSQKNILTASESTFIADNSGFFCTFTGPWDLHYEAILSLYIRFDISSILPPISNNITIFSRLGRFLVV